MRPNGAIPNHITHNRVIEAPRTHLLIQHTLCNLLYSNNVSSTDKRLDYENGIDDEKDD